jgi:hypothetical protein
MFSYFLNPVAEFKEGLVAVDGVDQEDGRDAFVEGADDGFEELLACLFGGRRTVSQICSRTRCFSSISTIFEEYSTPTVTLYCCTN